MSNMLRNGQIIEEGQMNPSRCIEIQHGIVERGKSQPENSIIDNFNQLYKLSRIFGLNGYYLPKERTDFVRMTPCTALYSLTIGTLIAINSLLNAKYNIKFNFSQSIIVNLVFAMTMATEALQCPYLILSDILNRTNIWYIITSCYDFDQQVEFHFLN